MKWDLYPQGGAQDSTADSVKVYRTYYVFMKLANGDVDTLGYGHATLRLSTLELALGADPVDRPRRRGRTDVRTLLRWPEVQVPMTVFLRPVVRRWLPALAVLALLTASPAASIRSSRSRQGAGQVETGAGPLVADRSGGAVRLVLEQPRLSGVHRALHRELPLPVLLPRHRGLGRARRVPEPRGRTRDRAPPVRRGQRHRAARPDIDLRST